MENLNVQKVIQKTYYIHAKDLPYLDEVIRLMPNYATKSTTNIVIVDQFFETPEKLLSQLDASIRIRTVGQKQTLSIVCKNDGVRREFETEMHFGDKIQDKNEYILFLEDKLQDIYTHRIDIDIARMLKNLKAFLYITTERRQLEIINNSGSMIDKSNNNNTLINIDNDIKKFSTLINIDNVMFSTKRHNVPDNVLEIKLNCVNDVANKTAFDRLVFTLEQKISLTPMDETKFDAGKRVFRAEY